MYSIAIDGPAGAGKSTIAKLVAKRLRFVYVDTGAMYRTMALACFNDDISVDDEKSVTEKCAKVNIEMKYKDGAIHIYLDGNDVGESIRRENIGNMASSIAVYPKVREILVDMQRKLANENDVVMDGRDIGTAVLPNANLKIYLTASVKTRAKRRYDELSEKGVSCDLSDIENDIRERDKRDIDRATSPLKKAEDAVLIDSSDMSIEEVTDMIVDCVGENG